MPSSISILRVDIFQHVLIGSEGTLAFIAEAVLNTVPDLPVKYTGLLLFPDLYAAAESIIPLRQAGAKALEIMDRASLRSVETKPEFRLRCEACRRARRVCWWSSSRLKKLSAASWRSVAADAVGGFKLCEPARFTHAAAEQALLWQIRLGNVPIGRFGPQERHHRDH